MCYNKPLRFCYCSVAEVKIIYYNHGQNIVDKFTKCGKIVVSLECLTSDFPQFSITTGDIWLLNEQSGTYRQFQTFQRFF